MSVPRVSQEYAGNRFYLSQKAIDGAEEVAVRMGRTILQAITGLEGAHACVGPKGSTKKGNIKLRPTEFYDGAWHTIYALVKGHREPVDVEDAHGKVIERRRLHSIIHFGYDVGTERPRDVTPLTPLDTL
jgi:hypothetical protein